MAGRAVFPGSFDPLTVGHLAVADAARDQLAVDAVDLVISEVALAKEHRVATSVDDRLAAIRRVRDAGRSWLGARSTTNQLLADIALGYDVLVIGSDKWHQLHDVEFYGGSPALRDEALSRLPLVAVAPRAGFALPAAGLRDGVALRILDVPPAVHAVSSTAVRGGRSDWRA